MRNFVLLLSVFILSAGMQSCKKDKNEPADQLIVDHQTETVANTEEARIEDAQSQPLTNLVLSENTFDFGDIKKGESVEHEYQVTNTGKNPLIISSVVPGCGCTAPDYTKDPIMPGKTGTITLKFDSSNFDGQIHKQAEVYANVEKTPIVIEFTGNVVQ